MHSILSLGLSGFAALLVFVGTATAQSEPGSPSASAAVNAVISFRTGWLEDSTRFDACSVYAALGRPADFPARIDESVRPALDRTTEPCAADSTRVASSWPLNFVRVDSVSLLGDSTARVFLSVRKQSEKSHFEAYEVKGLTGPAAYVHTMRVWGVMREYLVPPGRRRPAG